MCGRLTKIHKQLTTICFLVFALSQSIAKAESVKEISQSILRQHKIVRNSKKQEMSKYMNLSADPCQDFYAYACGNWAKYHVRLKEHEIVTASRLLEQKVEQDLINLLEDQVREDDGVNGRKVKEFYKSCVQALANGQKQQAFHSELIKNNGGFPAAPGSNWARYNSNYDWPHIVGQLRNQYSMDILIGIDIVVNPYNIQENTIYLTEPSTILPADICSAEGTKQIENRREDYEHIEREVTANLKNWLSLEYSEAKRVASDILLFEFELCTAMRVSEKFNDSQTSNPFISPLRRSLYELTHYFNDSIDFYKYISTVYSMNYAKPVAVLSEHYFQHLAHTISIHDTATLANYIMYRALSTLSFPLQDNKQNRPKFCTQITKRYFPQVVGVMYYHKYANIAAKFDVEEIFEKLKIALSKSLNRPWIEERTRLLGLAKLRDIVLHFPNYRDKPNLQKITIDANNFWKNLDKVLPQLQQQELMRVLASGNLNPSTEVEAHEVRLKFQNEFKRIDVGWALLQPPFYEEAYPQSIRYAMIGHKLAHELASAFDDIGWSSDVLGYANWDYLTALQFKNRTECFRRQLSYYLNNDGNTFQNITQLRALTTMSAGVNIAFEAYLDWLNYLNPNNDYSILRNETLSELNFTNTQLFFIAYAQLNCRHEENNGTVAACCPLQSHTLTRYIVNGPLSNNLEFGREFHCKIGSQLNAAEKCIIY